MGGYLQAPKLEINGTELEVPPTLSDLLGLGKSKALEILFYN